MPFPRLIVAGALALVLLDPPCAWSQMAGQQGGTQQGGTQQGGQQQGQQQGQQGGILVDSAGVVAAAKSGPRLDARRRQELAQKTLTGDVNTPSQLRKVSLVKLEQACEQYAGKKDPMPWELFYLAGIQRIEYVFIDPDEKDIVIAGPAEGFALNGLGRAVGVKSGRPCLRLDDLLVVLRTVGRGDGMLGCSIDPQRENMAAFQQYISQNKGPFSTEAAKQSFVRMKDILGMQNVRVFGVPAESHFANMLVEADYRMKLLSMDLEPAPVKGFKSHLDFVRPGDNATERFWFTPLYDALLRSEDGLAYQFKGDRVQLLAQEELVSNSGARTNAATTRVSTKNFAKQFTDLYGKIADASPIFAELQNGIDLAVMSAMIQKEGLASRINWDMSLFLDSDRLPIQSYNVPRQVMSTMNYKTTSGRQLIATVGGGVEIRPRRILMETKFTADDGVMKKLRPAAFEGDPPAAHRWWWD